MEVELRLARYQIEIGSGTSNLRLSRSGAIGVKSRFAVIVGRPR